MQKYDSGSQKIQAKTFKTPKIKEKKCCIITQRSTKFLDNFIVETQNIKQILHY